MGKLKLDSDSIPGTPERASDVREYLPTTWNEHMS